MSISSAAFVMFAQGAVAAQGAAEIFPGRYTASVLAWLAAYVMLLVAWAATATRTTMHARVTFGRSRLVRWISAVAGLIVFVVVPMTLPRLLLPGGVLLALAPIVYSIYGVYRKGGVSLKRAVRIGAGSAIMLAYAAVVHAFTTAVSFSWLLFHALLKLDWAALRDLPEMIQRARVRVQGILAPDSVATVTVLQECGLPLDFEADARLKGFSKSVMTTVNSLLTEGMNLGATDIMISARDQGPTEIRFQVDGIAHKGPALRGGEGALVARAVKTLAGAMVGGKSIAASGEFPVMYRGRRSDFFVETATSNNVETVTLRSTAAEKILIEAGLANVGMDEVARAATHELLRRSRGVLLFVGRPDSGKSTTIYAAIAELGLLGRNVAVVEKSTRHHLDHVAQINVGGVGATSFPATIQAALKHHPDVLVVRDIFDRQTAEACFREAAAGKLIIAGMTADDACDAIQRLQSIGIDSGTMRSSLNAVISQRLARMLCESCKAEYHPTPEMAAKLGLQKDNAPRLFRSVGCPQCRGTGFKGRVGVFEILEMSDALMKALTENTAPEAIGKATRANLKRSLRQSMSTKIVQGVTSVEEAIRVLK